MPNGTKTSILRLCLSRCHINQLLDPCKFLLFMELTAYTSHHKHIRGESIQRQQYRIVYRIGCTLVVCFLQAINHAFFNTCQIIVMFSFQYPDRIMLWAQLVNPIIAWKYSSRSHIFKIHFIMDSVHYCKWSTLVHSGMIHFTWGSIIL